MRRSRRDPAADDGWTSESSSGFALAGFLGVVFIGFTLLAMGPLFGIDTYFNVDRPPRAWVPVLHVMDRIGQRAVCLPILFAVAYWLCRRNRSWRPAVVALGSVLLLNFVVGVLKLGLGRDWPHTADPSFFAGGMAYPSGHSSNIVLVYGLLPYLVGRYARPSRLVRVLLWTMVVVLSVCMVFVSLTLDWHWFADLIAGLIIGGLVLQLTAALDHAVSADAFTHGWRAAVGDVLFLLRHPVAGWRRLTAPPARTPHQVGEPVSRTPPAPAGRDAGRVHSPPARDAD